MGSALYLIAGVLHELDKLEAHRPVAAIIVTQPRYQNILNVAVQAFYRSLTLRVTRFAVDDEEIGP